MDNRNFIAAVVVSLLILVGFHILYEKPQAERLARERAAYAEAMKTAAPAPVALTSRSAEGPGPAVASAGAPSLRPRAAIVQDPDRVPLLAPELHGSLNKRGGRLDDVTLARYRTTTEPDAPEVVLLSPAGTDLPDHPYYIESGWLSAETPVPTATTLWESAQAALTPASPVTLRWKNGQGVTFERTVAVDDRFVVTVTDRALNASDKTVTLYPFGLIARHGKPVTEDTYILHEGPIGVLDGTLTEPTYKDLEKGGARTFTSTGGWLGITDKYWLVALLPNQKEQLEARFAYDRAGATTPDGGVFQADVRGTAVSLAPGASSERTLRFFVGAKRLRVLDSYESLYDLPHFDRAIDFGWFYFLTKPFLYLLDFLGSWLGSLAVAIVIFTLMLKLLTLPLSLRSYRSMARMKLLQPEITRLQERFKDDRMQQGQAMMDLYRREKVNPLSGCFPTLIQIPIFFALYKVLYVGIEMRHAPLFGWIHDLSAPDPTSIFTLFGLIPAFPLIPHLGVWPILMGISMFIQQRLSPQPPDKNQARMFMFLPIIFTFMLANVAVGLIFYWTLSNLLSLGQQWYILKTARNAA